MAYQWLSQDQIHVDWELNPREMDMEHIRSIAAHMNENGYDPKFPIIVYENTTGSMAINNTNGDRIYHAATGHHRLEASLLKDEEFPNLPLSEVYVQIVEGSQQEFIRRMLIDNFQHVPGFNHRVGKMPTRTELRAMRYRLMFFPDVFEKGDRLLAKEWGCDGDTVGKMREAIISDVRNGNNPRTSNAHASHITDSDIEKIKQIVKDDLYLGIDGKKHPRTKQVIYKPTTERSTAGNPAPASKKTEPEEAKEALAEQDEEAKLKALREELIGIFTLHGKIPVYNPATQIMYTDEFEKKLGLRPGSAFRHITKFQKSLGNLQKDIKKQLQKNPDMEAESLAVAFSEDLEVVKTILARIEREQERPKHTMQKPASAPNTDDKARWNTKYLPRLADMFVELGVSENSVRASIGRAIQKQYGKEVYSLEDSEMTKLIDEANIVHKNAENPDLWVWNTGVKIGWALHVLSLVKEPDLPEPEYVEPVSDKSIKIDWLEIGIGDEIIYIDDTERADVDLADLPDTIYKPLLAYAMSVLRDILKEEGK